MKKIILIPFVFILFSCNQEKITKLKTGTYNISLKLNDNLNLPFNFEVINQNKLNIFNANDTIVVDDISYKNDSVYINMPVFTSYLVAKVDENGLLKGNFVKRDLNRIVPFISTRSKERFTVKTEATTTISGNWETTFSPDSKNNSYQAKGIFKQNDNKVTGTFRTNTGDYRYLEGVLDGDQLKLSTFDGAHAFLFTAKVTDSTMIGNFYSGNHWQEPFVAKRNENFILADANKLTYLKKGADKFGFSFPDANGNLVSLTDERFMNKVTIVQIFGTWCPNCLDESRYYSEYQKSNDNVKFVALAFEYVKTKEKAFEKINKFKKDIGINYPILLAQLGTTNKKKAQEKLPMLNHVLSYPTSIFIDKKGEVRKIHTGFNGPATGQKYLDFKVEFESFVDELVKE